MLLSMHNIGIALNMRENTDKTASLGISKNSSDLTPSTLLLIVAKSNSSFPSSSSTLQSKPNVSKTRSLLCEWVGG